MKEKLCIKLKVGSLIWLSQLQKEGVLYCNTLKHFTEIEDNCVRGDKHENAFDYKTQRNVLLEVWPVDSPYKITKLNCSWLQNVVRNEEPFGNLFCMYSMDMTNAGESGRFTIDARNKGFGEHILVFTETIIFDRLLKKS